MCGHSVRCGSVRAPELEKAVSGDGRDRACSGHDEGQDCDGCAGPAVLDAGTEGVVFRVDDGLYRVGVIVRGVLELPKLNVRGTGRVADDPAEVRDSGGQIS